MTPPRWLASGGALPLVPGADSQSPLVHLVLSFRANDLGAFPGFAVLELVGMSRRSLAMI
jgi:hypothetical protein